MVFSHLDIWKTSFPHWKVSRSHLCSLFSDRPIINMEFPHCKRISSNSFAFLFFSIANVFYELCTRDCEDIEALLLYLEKEFNYSQYFLMGHSTGCQDIVYFLKNSELAKKVKISSCILQVWVFPSRSLHLSFREPWATENTWCKIQMYSFPLLNDRNRLKNTLTTSRITNWSQPICFHEKPMQRPSPFTGIHSGQEVSA